jgi:hypothetical protein
MAHQSFPPGANLDGQKMDSVPIRRKQCLKTLCRSITALPELLSDGELRHLAGDILQAGPRPLYEAFRQLNAGAPLSFVLRRYARLGREPLRDFLASMDGQVLS